MNQHNPEKIPFTEDPAQKELTAYTTFTKSSYTSKLCDHFRKDELVYNVEDEDSKDRKIREANKIHVVEEDAEEGEGLIERKDLYTFCQNVLKDMRGYWAVEVGDTDTSATSPPLPVLQFGTLGLEIHPASKGTIKSVSESPTPVSYLAWLTLTCARLGTWDVELILRACIDYEKGKTTMKKVSGSGISDEKIRFRWCLRGPMIDRGTEVEPFQKWVTKKCKSFLQDVSMRKGSGKKLKAGSFADDG